MTTINKSRPIVRDLREKKAHTAASTGASVGRLRQPTARRGSRSSTHKIPSSSPCGRPLGIPPSFPLLSAR